MIFRLMNGVGVEKQEDLMTINHDRCLISQASWEPIFARVCAKGLFIQDSTP